MPQRAAVIASCVLLLGACGAAEESPVPPRVAVIQDGTFPDALSVVSPAVLALNVALGEAAEISLLDTDGTGGEEAVAEANSDPSVVAIVIAPFTALSDDGVSSLAATGLPVLSLSSLITTPPGSGPAWHQVVPPLAAEAEALAERAEALRAGGTVCLAGEGTAWSEGLRDLLRSELAGIPARGVGGPPAAAGAVARTECAVALWTGSAGVGAEFRAAFGASTPLLLASSARTAGYLDAGGPIEGVELGACPCTDPTTSAAAETQAFVHDYQAETGLEPGPFAVEGYDLGRLLGGLAATSGGRAGLSAAIADLSSFVGIMTTYRWDGEGDLVAPGVRMYEATGVRWLAEVPAARS